MSRLSFGRSYGSYVDTRLWRGLDVRLMREAGVNLVSLGIFSWALLEPRPGEYDFGWLDRIMGLLFEHGIMVDLATATASPPPWLAALHPESLPVTADGTTLWPGSRQQYCPSSEAYRETARALVEQIARRYRSHPALVMWHSNNEYGCHVSACYCDRSAEHFRRWLQHRYGSIDALNAAWGTAFWSQRYGDWSEIYPPRSAPTFVNPTQQLDFRRFSSDALLECFEQERRVLKELTPDIPVTTNFMGFFKPLDYWRWATREDVVSTDSYPDPTDPWATVDAAMSYDLIRSLGSGRPWVLMEQTTSQVNWRAHNALKRPGQMRLWSYQAVARGADGVMFFQWRASRAGAEKFHGALVPHVGTERSRIWREVTELGRELAGLDVVLETRVTAEVAIVIDWESWWGLEIDAKPSIEVKLLDQVNRYYRPLHRHNIAVDFVQPRADLSPYKVVFVPNLYMVGDGVAENLEGFVRNGGRMVMSFFSGIVDPSDHIRLGGYPAPFRRLLGIRVEEFDPYVPGQTNEFVTVDGVRATCETWSDVIDLEGADAIAHFAHDFYAGRPAITRHGYGSGYAYYLGTNPDASYFASLLTQICAEVGVRAPIDGAAGVEVVRRASGSERLLFLLNHQAEPATVSLDFETRDLLTGTEHVDTITLPAYGVAILREPGSSNHRMTWTKRGSDMVPTLRDGDLLQVDLEAYSSAVPARGDIVLLQRHEAERRLASYVKRVIALPQEEVEIRPDAGVYVNGHRLEEPYVTAVAAYRFGPVTVPEDEYFVLGDNRNNSVDSHLRGPVPRRDIVGKVVEVPRGRALSGTT